MPKSWVRQHKLAYVLIACPIIGFVLYLDTGSPLIFLAAPILGGLLAYKLLLPLLDKLLDSIDAHIEKLKKRWGLDGGN